MRFEYETEGHNLDIYHSTCYTNKDAKERVECYYFEFKYKGCSISANLKIDQEQLLKELIICFLTRPIVETVDKILKFPAEAIYQNSQR